MKWWVVILSADNWVCILVSFVIWMRNPAQDATGSLVMLGLVYSACLCGSSDYLIVSRIRCSPVV